MTTIEDKIKLFSKIVYDRIDEEKNKEFEEFEREKQRVLLEENQKIEKFKKDAANEISKKASIKANETIAKEKLIKQQEILKVKEELIKDAETSLMEKLKEFCNSNEYKNYYFAAINNTLNELPKGNYIMYVSPRDFDRFEKETYNHINCLDNIKLEIKKSERDIIGGIIIEELEGRFRMDNSLYAKLVGSKEKLGVRIIESIE